MAVINNIETIMNAAQGLSFEEWMKTSKAITRAFAEKEHSARKELKLNDVERIKYFYTMIQF